MRYLFVLALFLAAPKVLLAKDALICLDCAAVADANAIAKTLANELQCSAQFDPNYNCSSQNKIVTLVDRDTGNTFKFNVYHDQNFPWTVNASELSISSNDRNAFRELAKFWKALGESIANANASGNVSTNNNTTSSQSTDTNSSNDSCPTDTALQALVDPNQLEHIQSVAMAKIGTGLVERYNESNLQPQQNQETASLNAYGFTYSVSSQANTRLPFYVEGFPNSERPSSVSDYLLFQVTTLAYNANGLPIIAFELSDASRIAGYSLAGLRGKNGPLEIDNQCVKDRLQEAVDNGILTQTSTEISSTPLSSNEGGALNPDGSVGFSQVCDLIEFYQGGLKRYTFRTCRIEAF